MCGMRLLADRLQVLDLRRFRSCSDPGGSGSFLKMCTFISTVCEHLEFDGFSDVQLLVWRTNNRTTGSRLGGNQCRWSGCLRPASEPPSAFSHVQLGAEVQVLNDEDAGGPGFYLYALS